MMHNQLVLFLRKSHDPLVLTIAIVVVIVFAFLGFLPKGKMKNDSKTGGNKE